jgi:hypothetical protein
MKDFSLGVQPAFRLVVLWVWEDFWSVMYSEC